MHALLRTLPGCGLVMRLSLVASTCVCITVKDADGELLDLEPLDAKRLQAKNLHDYLMDIIIDEKVRQNLDKNWCIMKSDEWILTRIYGPRIGNTEFNIPRILAPTSVRQSLTEQ